MSIIDSEIKKLFFTLISACLFLTLLVWIAANYQSFFNFSTGVYNFVTGQKTYNEPYKYNLDKNKTYSAVITTTLGDMTFKLDKDVAPDTVNNFVNLVKNDFYKKTSTSKDTNLALFGQGNSTNYKISEEINADSLGLNQITVSQYYGALKDVYDQNLLNQNLSKSVKDFLMAQGYQYRTDIVSKPIAKGSLIMYAANPQSFNNVVAIAIKGAVPSLEGRMTHFGDITSGQDVLDKIMSSTSEQFTVTSVTITEK